MRCWTSSGSDVKLAGEPADLLGGAGRQAGRPSRSKGQHEVRQPTDLAQRRGRGERKAHLLLADIRASGPGSLVEGSWLGRVGGEKGRPRSAPRAVGGRLEGLPADQRLRGSRRPPSFTSPFATWCPTRSSSQAPRASSAGPSCVSLRPRTTSKVRPPERARASGCRADRRRPLSPAARDSPAPLPLFLPLPSPRSRLLALVAELDEARFSRRQRRQVVPRNRAANRCVPFPSPRRRRAQQARAHTPHPPPALSPSPEA